jgi:hypothetical protein
MEIEENSGKYVLPFNTNHEEAQEIIAPQKNDDLAK